MLEHGPKTFQSFASPFFLLSGVRAAVIHLEVKTPDNGFISVTPREQPPSLSLPYPLALLLTHVEAARRQTSWKDQAHLNCAIVSR